MNLIFYVSAITNACVHPSFYLCAIIKTVVDCDRDRIYSIFINSGYNSGYTDTLTENGAGDDCKFADGQQMVEIWLKWDTGHMEHFFFLLNLYFCSVA